MCNYVLLLLVKIPVLENLPSFCLLISFRPFSYISNQIFAVRAELVILLMGHETQWNPGHTAAVVPGHQL